ncbi:signal peptidase II [Candidatus Woesearchaeota archaeon]|nr:signal peptidase II [Candidatus Woesearchaeota archaeon]
MKRFWVYVIAAVVLSIDAVTKYVVRLYQPDIDLLPFFSLTFVTNTGAAFGILKGSIWFLALVSIAVMSAIIYYLPKMEEKYLLPAALILGGTIGNLLDRLFIGFVTDFISLGWWPSFNIADSSLSIGFVWILLIILYDDFLSRNKTRK